MLGRQMPYNGPQKIAGASFARSPGPTSRASNESWGRSWPAGSIPERGQLRLSTGSVVSCRRECWNTLLPHNDRVGLAMSSPVSGILLLCENNTSSI
jgi:hypothetical protein